MKQKAAKRASHSNGNGIRPNERTDDALISAGIKLFASKGLEGTTVKDIAETAGVNISLVSYYFQGKEGLYRTCLEKFGKDRLVAAKRLLVGPTSVEDMKVRLELFSDEMFECYLREPDLVSIIHREADLSHPLAVEVFKGSFIEIFKTLVVFLNAAVENGILRKNVNTHIAASSIMACITYFMRSDKLSAELFDLSIVSPKYREEVKNQISQIFLEGIVSHTVSKEVRVASR